MKTCRIIVGIAFIGILAACGPQHKSVLEPLTPQEVEQLGEKYKDFKFVSFYEDKLFPQVLKVADNSPLREELKNLSYDEYVDFINYTQNNDDKEEAYTKEWKERFDMDKINHQVDSIVAYWKKRYPRLPKGYIVIPSELEIPSCVYNYITKGYEMYRNYIIKEYIDKDYLDEQQYVFRRLSVDEYNYNPVAFSLKKGVEFAKITKEYIESGIFK